MNDIKTAMLALIVIAVVVWVIWADTRKPTKPAPKYLPGFSDEDIEALRRKNDLFHHFPIREREWQTLNTDELLQVFLAVLDVQCRRHAKEKHFSPSHILFEMSAECKHLIQWTIGNIEQGLVYENMTKKAREVASRLYR